MRRTMTSLLAAGALAGAVVLPATSAGAAPVDPFPEVIALPDGFSPEGISTGRGTAFYVGSRTDGSIYRGDLRTGDGALLVEGTPGGAAIGTEVDRRGRLWVAGGATGTGTVYDTRTGEVLASYALTAPGATFVNDVVVTRDAAYFTDSVNPVLYVVPLGPGGRPAGPATTLPLTGDLQYQAGFNANGIEASPDGETLLVVQSNTGLLFRVAAGTGVTTRVDLGGASLTNSDGLLRQGRTLYVVRNALQQIAVLELADDYASAALVDTLTDPDFQTPTTVAPFGSALYAVNARFDAPQTPETEYTVVRVG
ncbi:sugar lactone lactonase YvrE [Geodermatophilus bullaregiensis]|uniref:hypothetical protein n=1 Tax=Geodermatophilus bullaregiensis TaxID=1564160 RepID=UPI00195C913F|nr:hypothetical protein [Geodermatophilus bullaregiensis]MBM7805817.1 sugar lactone lactonase YvrE [Geodermatophilus bullaregiensis]